MIAIYCYMFNFSVPGLCEGYIWTTWTHFIAPNKLNTKHCTGCMLPLLIYRVEVHVLPMLSLFFAHIIVGLSNLQVMLQLFYFGASTCVSLCT